MQARPRTVVVYCVCAVLTGIALAVPVYNEDGPVLLMLGPVFWGLLSAALVATVWHGHRLGWWINLVLIVRGLLTAALSLVNEARYDSAINVGLAAFALVAYAFLTALLLSPAVRSWTQPSLGSREDRRLGTGSSGHEG